MQSIRNLVLLGKMEKQFLKSSRKISLILRCMNSKNVKQKSAALEPVCCKKRQKSSCPVTGLQNRGPLNILNGIKLILDDQGNHLDSYTISLESFRSFRGPLFRKPVTGQELFLLFLTANRLQLRAANLNKSRNLLSDFLVKMSQFGLIAAALKSVRLRYIRKTTYLLIYRKQSPLKKCITE